MYHSRLSDIMIWTHCLVNLVHYFTMSARSEILLVEVVVSDILGEARKICCRERQRWQQEA